MRIPVFLYPNQFLVCVCVSVCMSVCGAGHQTQGLTHTKAMLYQPYLSEDGHCSGYEVLPHCGFDLHFPLV
jgi:hypothetical protein